MKLIIPMAGRGSRLRPHTLTVPKPLVPVAGKPIVHRIAEDLIAVCPEPVDEIAFIIGDFGDQVEKDLIKIAEKLGAKGSVYHQEEPLGTAHAILCAKDSLNGPCIVAFADTLFKATFDFDTSLDGVIWANEVEDPSAFGVLVTDDKGYITEFVEKPTEFVSNLAIIGIYYFKDGDNLKAELQYLLDNNIKDKGEFQLTNALENMKQKGLKFKPATIDEWLDCGNKDAVIYSNNRMLEIKKSDISTKAKIENSIILEPSFIGEGAVIENSVVGPHVSIGENTKIINSVIKNSIIQADTIIEDAILEDSMIGFKAHFKGRPQNVSIGDYSQQK